MTAEGTDEEDPTVSWKVQVKTKMKLCLRIGKVVLGVIGFFLNITQGILLVG